MHRIISLGEGFFQRIIDWGKRFDYWQWGLLFLGLVMVRMLIINLDLDLPGRSGTFRAAFFLQDLFFFLIVIVLIWIWLSWVLKMHPKELLGILLWGNWLIVLPLVIDLVGTGRIQWSFYLLNSLEGLGAHYYSFFGNLPPAVVYFGTRWAALLAVLFSSVFVLLRTKNIWKAAATAVAVYSIFFFAASLPSWIAFCVYALEGRQISSVSMAEVASAIGSPSKVWGIDHRAITSAIMFKTNLVYVSLVAGLAGAFAAQAGAFSRLFFQRKRLKECLVVTVPVVIGLLFGGGLYPEHMQPGFFAWFALADLVLVQLASWKMFRIIAGISRENLPLSVWPATDLVLFSGIAAVGSLSLGIDFFLFWLAVGVLFLVILGRNFGVGRYFFADMLLKWLGIMFGFAVGFMLVSSNQTLEGFPWGTVSWLSAGMAIILLPDVEAYKNRILAHSLGRMGMGAALFIYFVISAAVFRDSGLFGGALVAGGAAYWIIETKRGNSWKFISTIYLLLLAYIFGDF